MKNLQKMLTPGLIPMQVWNTAVDIIMQLQNITVGPGLELTRSATGFEISFTRTPNLPLTFQLQGLLVENAQNVCKKLRTVEAMTVFGVWAYVGTPSTDGSVDLDINLSETASNTDYGTSIYTTTNKKPSIPQDKNQHFSTIPDSPRVIPPNTFVGIDLDSVGEAAEDLTVIIVGK